MNVLQICIENDLQQHARRKATCSTTFICGFDCADVEMLYYGIKYAYWIIFRNKVTDTVRKNEIIVLIVRFILPLPCQFKLRYYFDFALQI